jgi:cell division septation protein DedD
MLDENIPSYPTTVDKPKSGKVIILLLFIIVMMLVAGLYFFYTKSTLSVNQDELVIIRADPTPTKIKPKDPGGMVFANMDKTIYDNLAVGNDNLPKVERILPPPEEPIDINPVIVPVVALPPPSAPAALAPATPAEVDLIDLLASGVDLPEEVIAGPAPVEQIIKPKEELIKPLPEKQKIKFSKTRPKVRQATGFKIQLAAFKSEKDANIESKRIKKKYRSLLGKYEHIINKKDIVSKGVMYRLQLGYIKSESAARLLCRKLVATNQECFVVKD